VDTIFDTLIIPSLNDLHLQGFLRCRWLQNLLIRSSCQLLSLSLVDIVLDNLEIDSILQKTPRLEILRLSYNFLFFDNLFERLGHTKFIDKSSLDPEMTFLPCLHSLQCDDDQGVHFSWRLIPPMFASAAEFDSPDSRPLCKLSISAFNPRSIDKGIARQLWELQQHYQLTIRDENGADIIERSYKKHFF